MTTTSGCCSQSLRSLLSCAPLDIRRPPYLLCMRRQPQKESPSLKSPSLAELEPPHCPADCTRLTIPNYSRLRLLLAMPCLTFMKPRTQSPKGFWNSELATSMTASSGSVASLRLARSSLGGCRSERESSVEAIPIVGDLAGAHSGSTGARGGHENHPGPKLQASAAQGTEKPIDGQRLRSPLSLHRLL